MSLPTPLDRDAGARRSGQGWARQRPPKGSSLTASSTTAHLIVSGDDKSEGSCGLVHEASCHILVCGGPKTQTMMQGYASAASSAAADPFFLELGIEVADAEPRQGRLDAVDGGGLLANEGLALAVGASEGGDRTHLAVVALAAQPAEETQIRV